MNRTAPEEQAATEVAVFAPSRLKWHDAIEEKFGDIGVTRATWKALTDAVFPNAQSVDSVVLALSYCKARKLDPFKRCVHIVPMWSKERNAMVDTVWPGIAELRTTAFRTGSYAGKDAAEFGEDLKYKVGNKEVAFPDWCRITIYRRLGSNICKFVGPKVYWLETYGRVKKNDETPNSMWLKRPRGQIEKCAEAAALRSAYPEEIGNEYVPEEMVGHTLIEHENGTYHPSPRPEGWPTETAKDAWGGPLAKMKFKEAMTAFSADLEACEDYDQLIALLNVKETIDLLAQCQRDKPSFWFGVPDSDVLGYSARIETRKVDLAAEQEPVDA